MTFKSKSMVILVTFKKSFLNFNNNNQPKQQLLQVAKALKHQKVINKRNRVQFRNKNKKYHNKKDKINAHLNQLLIKVRIRKIILELFQLL